VVEGWSKKGKEGHQCQFIPRCIFSKRWNESLTDFPITVAVLFEHTKEEFQLSWETFLVADGSSSMYQGG